MIEFNKVSNHTVPTQLKVSNQIRERITSNNAIRITPEEHDKLAELYQAVTNLKNPVYSCGGCIGGVYKTLNNWFDNYEQRRSKAKPVKTKVIEVTEDKPKLSELRKQYPHIRATSVSKFLEKIEEENSNA